MALMGERRASGRSRSSRAASSQSAGQEVWRPSCDDDRHHEPLPDLSQELPGYFASLSSELAVSVSTGPADRKRKWQSGSQEGPDDERLSTSFKTPAKLSFKGRSRSSRTASSQSAGQEVWRRSCDDDRDHEPLPDLSQELPGYFASLSSELAVSVSTGPADRKRKWQSGSQEGPDDERLSTSFKTPAKLSFKGPADRKRKWQSGSQEGPDDERLSTSFKTPAKLSLKGPADRKRKWQSGSQEGPDDERLSTSFKTPAKLSLKGPADRKRKWQSGSQEGPDDERLSTSFKTPAKLSLKGPADRKRKWQSCSQEGPDDERLSTSFKTPANLSLKEAYAKGPLLGQGGFGSVYAGIRRSDGLPVAIKYVSKDRALKMLKAEGQGLLPLEVELMTRVNSAPACPNVLQLVEWFERHTRYSMILERPVPCQDLKSFCEDNGCLDESLAKKVLVQLITALKHCESRGVLHRDVKPENLLISTASHDIKLLDFGCGALLKDSAYTSFAGTLEYAPPEWFDQHYYHAGPATVWSVGVTLYNILCFPFIAAHRISFKSRLIFPRELSTECCQLISWCLSDAAADRPSLDDIKCHPWLQ